MFPLNLGIGGKCSPFSYVPRSNDRKPPLRFPQIQVARHHRPKSPRETVSAGQVLYERAWSRERDRAAAVEKIFQERAGSIRRMEMDEVEASDRGFHFGGEADEVVGERTRRGRAGQPNG